MEHRIKVKIADRTYTNPIHSEEEEMYIRRAVKSVNNLIQLATQKYSGVSALDVLTIVALNEGIEKEKIKAQLEKMQQESSDIAADLQKFVDSLK